MVHLLITTHALSNATQYKIYFSNIMKFLIFNVYCLKSGNYKMVTMEIIHFLTCYPYL